MERNLTGAWFKWGMKEALFLSEGATCEQIKILLLW